MSYYLVSQTKVKFLVDLKQVAEEEYEISTLLQKIMTIYTGCPKKIPDRIFEFGHLFFWGRLGTFGHFGHPRAF